jgi:hypothetical protein
VPVKLPKGILFLRQKATRKMRRKHESSKGPLEESPAPVRFLPAWIVPKEAEAKYPAQIWNADVYCDHRENDE